MRAQLAWARVAIGAVLFLAARPLLQMGGGGGAAGEAALRGLGGRDLVIGAGQVATLDDPSSTRWLTAGLASDAFDALAVVLAWRRLPKRRRALLLLAALGGATSGAALLATNDTA
jgi:hypothetical protein